MAAVDQSGLPPSELNAVRSALERDPALCSELEMILEAIDPAARGAFWQAFAELGGVGDRPVSAVLPALIRTARGAAG